MSKKKQTRKIVRLVPSSGIGGAYYTTRRGDGEKLEANKFNSETRKHEVYREAPKSQNLGRNEVKKRK